MMIGGNVNAILQHKTSFKNTFGVLTDRWETITTIRGFLDYIGGDGSYKTTYRGKISETTHIFICDYVNLGDIPTSRLLINGKHYEILLIDDPMGLHRHLELFLKYNEVIK